MKSSASEVKRTRAASEPAATYVLVSDTALSVTLADGRTILVPLEWYPRLAHGSPAERNRWELSGGGTAIHWPDLDEDVSVEGLVAGRRSMENARSLARWLKERVRGRKAEAPALPLPDWAQRA